MELEMNVVGSLNLTGPVCLTDPCYYRDVWCRINDIEIVPGEYECVAWLSDEGEWGKRVAKLGVYLNEAPDPYDIWNMQPLDGEVGVDAGLACVYQSKPDFTDDEWEAFCDMIHDEYPTKHLHDGDFEGRLVGFTTSSGYGDGGYSAFVEKNEAGLVKAIEIIFIDDEEYEIDEDEEEKDNG